MTKKAYTCDGEPIETLSHEKLCEILGELIDKQIQDREELHRRRLDSIWVVPESMRKNVVARTED